MEVTAIGGSQGRVPHQNPASEGVGFKTEAATPEASSSQQQSAQPKFQTTSIHMDSGSWVAVLQVRDPGTGDLVVQVPSQQALEEYKRNGAEDSSNAAPKPPAEAQGTGVGTDQGSDVDPAVAAASGQVDPAAAAAPAAVAAAAQQAVSAPPAQQTQAPAEVKGVSNAAASQSVKLVV